MAQITESVCRGILNGQGYTDWEVKQLAHYWLHHQAAKQERTPLTDDDIRKIYGQDLNYRDGDFVRFARAIEAAITGSKT